MSGEEDIDCRAIWDSIEKDTEELLKADISEELKKNMVNAINERMDKIHKDIDSLGDEFVNKVIDNFNAQKETTKEDDKGKVMSLNRIEKKEKEEREKRLEEINKLTNEVEKKYQLEMEDLISSVNQMIKKVSIIDVSSSMFNSCSIEELLTISKDNFRFKVERKLGTLLRGKNAFELFWDAKKNNASYSTVDKDDNTNLKVHGTTCYTYYQTNQKFTEEDFVIEVEYNINTSDNYFYLGLINQSVVPSSNCMCCTISNGFYIQPNGDVVINAKRTNNSKLNAAKGQVHLVIFRVSLAEKKMWVTMDDKDEQGPFDLCGSTYTFVSGSCNSVNGYVKIVNSYYC